jgi:hypothetical protein
MSTPTNGAARNAMSEFERQCYDWGWEDNEERIIKLLEEDCHSYDGEAQCPCGAITPQQVDYVVALIKGSQNVGAEIDNPSEGENK